MKRVSKFLSLSVVALMTLTSCAFVAKVMGNIIVNATHKSQMVVNAIDLMPDGKEVDPQIIEFEKTPTVSENRARLEYFKNVLVIPHDLTTNVLNTDIVVDFVVDAGDNQNAFKHFTVTKDELPEDFNLDLSSLPVSVDFTLSLFVPVGDSTFLDDVNTLSELEEKLTNSSRETLIEETKQESKEVDLKVTIKSSDTKKHKTFYFTLEKPDFSEAILNEVFSSKYLVNIYHEKDNTIENLEVLPTDPDNRQPLKYFRDSLAIPEKVTIKDIGDVTFTVETTRPELFFNMYMEKPITEIDPENTVISGDIGVTTLTPVGTYKDEIPASVSTIDDLRDHFSNLETKTLYQYLTQPNYDFDITITATTDGKSRTETYYFTLVELEIDDEIGAAIIKDYNMVNYIDHTDLTKSVDNPVQPRDIANPHELRYFKESLVFPKAFTFSDFPDKEITFNIDLHGSEPYFYHSVKDHTYEGQPISGQTFSPVGTYDTSSITSFNSLVDHVQNNASEIYAHNASEVTRNVKITLSVYINEVLAAQEDYYFILIPF